MKQDKLNAKESAGKFSTICTVIKDSPNYVNFHGFSLGGYDNFQRAGRAGDLKIKFMSFHSISQYS